MRLFGTCSSEDREAPREPAYLPRPRDALARRLVARALVLLAACAPCVAGAHTAGASTIVDVMECVAHARMHPGTAPRLGANVTYAVRDGLPDGAPQEFPPASTQSDPELPASGCDEESDARPRMNPGRLAHLSGGLIMPVTWRERFVPDDGAPTIGACRACLKCLAARNVARTPVTCAAATPFSRFERAARGPPASAVAPHR